MSNARNIAALSTVEVGATADQTKSDLNAIGVSGGRKNLIINGGMQVSQRGTSFSGISAMTHTLDRMKIAFGGGFEELAVKSEQSSDSPDGFSNSHKLTITTAETTLAVDERLSLMFDMEGQDVQHLGSGTVNAKAVTMSFLVKSSVVGTYALYAYGYQGNEIESHSITVDLANTWEKKSVTFSANTSTSLFANDNSKELEVALVLSAGSNFKGAGADTWSVYSTTNLANAQTVDIASTLNATFQITGVQLELGSVATDFEHRSFGEELALCQRYYEIIADGGRANDSPYFGVGQGVKSDQINWFYDFKAEKRATFTLIVPTVSNGYAAKTHSTTKSHSTLGFASVHQSLHSIMGYMTNIGGVTEQSCWQMQLNSASAHIAVSAEL